MNDKKVIVTKMSGEQVPFEKEKLISSLTRSGANEDVIAAILTDITAQLHHGIATKTIYQSAFKLLKKHSRPIAARYKLKKAILELGPTGYPFENYIASILNFQDYHTQVGQIIQGHCISHEVDILAQKNENVLFVECKFHSNQKRTCDVKIPLYINSRILDLKKGWAKIPENKDHKTSGWIVTNTRFTSDALQYGNCAGLTLIGWDYPKKGSLRERIDISGLHPITCLTTLTRREKDFLLNEDIVLIKQLLKQESLLLKMGISPNRQKKVLKEITGTLIV